MVRAGSFPTLRTGTNPTPSLSASAPPRMNPRLSMAITASARWPRHSSVNRSRDRRKAMGSFSSVVMSLKTMPGFGKSGTSRMKAFNDSALDSRLMAPESSSRRRRLADVEALAASRLHLHAFDGSDLRERRPLAQPFLEPLQHGIVPLGDHLDRSVGQVAGEARHPEPLRLPQDEVAVTHALDAAAYEVTIGGHQPPLEWAGRAM